MTIETIAGGTVRYVDVDLLPCPEDTAVVGQCERAAALDILWQDRILETFRLAAGDYLRVPDGAVVTPGSVLATRPHWHTVRATHPPDVEAIAHWSEPLEELVDDVTDLPRTRFPPGSAPLRLELHSRADDTCLVAYELDRFNATPVIRSGALVRRGDPLATIMRPWRYELHASFDGLRSFLDARPLDRRSVAAVSPCDGIVEAIEPDAITLQSRDGRRLHLRRPRRNHPAVRTGDAVGAGDLLTHGDRSHHALLHAWGEARLSEHILDELELLLGASVPRAYCALAMRAMLAWRRIREPGDTGLARGAVVPREHLDRLQHATRARGGIPATADPVLRGIGAIARERHAQRRAAPL